MLKVAVHYVQLVLRNLAVDYSWIYIVSPAVGIILTLLFIKYALNGRLVRGTSHVILAIARKSSFLPRRETYSHVVTSALTVGFGGSAGLESPIVQTGSAIGSVFSSFFNMSYSDRTLLLACGAAAGIATAFNAPIAGVLFAIEVLLIDVSASAFIPLLIAGATGALCSKIILSEGILLSFRQITDFNYHNIPYYIVLGIICGLYSVFYIRMSGKIETIFQRIASAFMRLAVGVVLLGLLVLSLPALFGEGYSSIIALASDQPALLFKGSVFATAFQSSPFILAFAILATGLMKVFAVSFTLNAGGNGGNFAPSLLAGACLGYSVSIISNLSGFTHLPTTNFCLVAMAGVLTGIFHSPLTAIFLIAEITGGYDLMIPLMIVSALSTGVSKFLSPHSLDEIKLFKQGGSFKPGKDNNILSQLSLENFIEKDFTSIRLGTTLRQLTNEIGHSSRNTFPVLDEHANLKGIVLLEDIRLIMFNTELYDSVIVDSLMHSPSVLINTGDDMHRVMEKFDTSGAWNIPVVNNGKYVGFISKSRVFSNYRERLKME
ncbi:MAG: chloride channel protein [Bacteroidota bacterium]